LTTDTDKLIESLSQDLKPVKRLPRAAVRAAIWSVATLVFIGIAICTLTKGFRADLAEVARNHLYLSETVAIFMAGVLATLAAFRLFVPDTQVRPPVRAAVAISTLIWLGLVGGQLAKAGLAPPSPAGEPCLTDLSLLMALPLVAAVVMAMRTASVFPALAGYCVVLAAGSFGALGMRLLCPNDDPAHLLAWHFMPVMIFALCGLPLGMILLKGPFAKKFTK
jgi:hypothetical protein